MNPLYGSFTTDQRDALATTGDTLALLPIPGCRDLSTRLHCIATTRRPTADQIHEATALAATVQRALLIETSPDRWIDEITGLDPALANDIVADLIAQRRQQAEQVGAVVTLLHGAKQTEAHTA